MQIHEKDEEILSHLIDVRTENLKDDEEMDTSNRLDKEDDDDEEEEEEDEAASVSTTPSKKRSRSTSAFESKGKSRNGLLCAVHAQ